ncbi:MAG: DUF2335 domain-containing protein [Fimbriiglobus sp.]
MSKRSKRIARQENATILPAPGSPSAPGGRQTLAFHASTSFHSGPIPDPDTLAAYNDIDDGFAGRIMAMAERQSAHRQEIEKYVIRHDTIRSYSGTALAFVLAVASIISGTILVLRDYPQSGVSIATLTVVALATTFLRETNARRTARAEAKQQLHPPRQR